jgi:hypothetical protein
MSIQFSIAGGIAAISLRTIAAFFEKRRPDFSTFD